jgi:uncharacterized repeat protein (TIGR01451 family)
MKTNIAKVTNLAVLIFLLFMFMPLPRAFAATKTATQVCTLGLLSTDWTRNCNVVQFNPALGNLTSVLITNSASIQGNLGVENADNLLHVITTEFAGEVTLRRPDNTTLLQTDLIGSAQTFNATSFDGIVDFAGTSGTTYTGLTAAQSSQLIVSTAPDLGLFIGTANLAMPVNAIGTSVSTGSGNIDTQYRTSALATVTIVYTYQALNLAITKVHSGNLIAGQLNNYTLTVRNLESIPTAGTTTITDTLPATLTYVSGTGNGWTCSNNAQIVTCTRAEAIPANSSVALTLRVRVAASARGSITNTASVVNSSLPDDVPANNSSSATNNVIVVATLANTGTYDMIILQVSGALIILLTIVWVNRLKVKKFLHR